MKKIYFPLCVAVLLSSFFLVNKVFAQPPATPQTFNTSGTYVVNAGFTVNVTIEAWGAGGGGSNNQAGGGGGGGAYSFVTTTLTAGSYAVTVGTGGTAGIAGGNSSFTALVVAGGGGSSANNTGGAGGVVITGSGRPGGGGGNTNNGNASGAGGGGSATSAANGGIGGNGVNGANAAGGAGGTGQGNGGAGANNSAGATAGAGVAPGGGGGGRSNNGTSSAASGANGRVVVTVNSVLPVKLSDVRAFGKGTGVQVEWTNLTEKDVLNYIVERSANGRDFATLSQLGSRSNQSDKQSYLSIDAAPLPGTNYYRIKVVEIDGKITYSKLLRVDIGGTIKGIVLYPNPVAGDAVYINFTAAKGQYMLQVFNTAGQQVYSKGVVHPGGSVSQSVELPSSLKTGVYNMVVSGDSYRENKMFIKQ
jgi:hypothetical protein